MVEHFQSSYKNLEKSRLEELLLEQQEKSTVSEKYLGTIIESSLDGITVVNEDGKFEFGNDSFFRIMGWPKEEIIGQYFIKAIPEDAREFVTGHWNNIKKDHGGLHEIKVKTKSGEIKYLNVSSSLVEINGENKVVAILHDISENKRQEMKLKESEEKYRNIFETSNDCIYIYDPEGYFQEVNNAALKLLQCANEEIIGTHMSEWITPESLKKSREMLQKQIEGKSEGQSIVLEVISTSGEHKWVEVTGSIIKDGNKVVAIHGIGRDITEKIRLEQQLRESGEKYRDLFENAQDAMYVVSANGNFLNMNQVGIQTLECTAEEVIGSNISKWLTPESLKIVNKRRKKLLRGEKVNTTDIIEIICKNGEHRWVEIKSRVIKNIEGTKEIHGIARDVTENILLKQQLKKSTKQQRLLCHLIKGTRGGKSRALILKHLNDRSYNAHQLAMAINMDYKTVRHHLKVLVKNRILEKGSDGYSDLYFISNNMEADLNHELMHDGNQ